MLFLSSFAIREKLTLTGISIIKCKFRKVRQLFFLDEFVILRFFLEEEEKDEQNIVLKTSLYGRKLKGKEIKIDPKFIGF